MGLREDLLKKIDKKTTEIQTFEGQIREANAYIQGLQDVLRMLPRDGADDRKSEQGLRQNSDVAKARDILKRAGKPMYVGEILQAMGKENSSANRLSLSGSLGVYVRKNEIFSRPAPNTFGLHKFEEGQIPDTFGARTAVPLPPSANLKSTAMPPPKRIAPAADDFDDSDPFADE